MSDEDDDDRIDEDQLNEEADIAADFLEELLDIMDYEGDIEMGIRNGRPVVQIVADDDTDIKHLIGRDGEVVTALQQLTRLAVQQKTGERSRVILDVDGYLTRRRKRIRDMALDAIDEVRETGEPVSLDPMNSFERKIVHDIVREEGLRSKSHDAEPHRYVTISLKKSSAEDEDDEDEDDEGFVDDATLVLPQPIRAVADIENDESDEDSDDIEDEEESADSEDSDIIDENDDEDIVDADEDVEDAEDSYDPDDSDDFEGEDPEEDDYDDADPEGDADEEHDDEVDEADVLDEEDIHSDNADQ